MRDVITALVAKISLSPDVLQQIVEKADGVPLFVEELTRTALDSVIDVRTARQPAIAIPATLHDSLTARLDRLPQEKSVAQLAAVIGRSFAVELLAAVAGLSPDRLEQSLARLADAGLVYKTRAAPETFEFKHALIQEAATSRSCEARGASITRESPARSSFVSPRSRGRSPKSSPTTTRKRDCPTPRSPDGCVPARAP